MKTKSEKSINAALSLNMHKLLVENSTELILVTCLYRTKIYRKEILKL